MHRLYIEDFDQSKGIWAIDTGPGTEQLRFEQVVWYSVGSTRYNLDADNIKEPKCWLEFPETELKIFGTTALLR